MNDKLNPSKCAKSPWRPMTIREVGEISSVVRGGAGKLMVSGADMGDTNKPSGQM